LAEDLRFVHELRARGYSDLAREYLEKLAQTASAELKRELPLEMALTNMESANDEPDSGKRLTLYTQARADLQKFLADNPGNPRAADARFEIARATTLQGKTQLSRALLDGDLRSRIADGLKARATLVAAANQLKALPSTRETQLAAGLNLIDQAQTYLNTGSNQELLDRTKPVLEAQKILDKLAAGDPNDKITWQARAWAARCVHELGEPRKARTKYNDILAATVPAARDGKRLARYFSLLALQEAPEEAEKKNLDSYIINRASDWIDEYHNYGRTAEGYGIRFLLADTLLKEAEAPAARVTAAERNVMLVRARKYLRELEQTENDYTDRAKRLKLFAMQKQGAFKKPINQLQSFEDCYERAQFEIAQIGEDAQKYKDDNAKREAARKTRMDAAVESLRAGLKKRDARTPSVERNNARAMLAFYVMNEGKYKEAIEIGETFARADPRPSQASVAAIYALLSYGQLIARRERDAADPKALQNDPQYQDDKKHMLDLAKYMEERWPKDRAGDLARHQIALRLLREEKIPEAIQKLSAITRTYPSYISTQFALARAALQQAEQDKSDSGGYRKRALAALMSIPDPGPSAEPDINLDYMRAKITLGWELFHDKKFKEVDGLVQTLPPKLESLRLLDDPAKEREVRGKLAENLGLLKLYSKAHQAETQFKAGHYAEVAKLLDPIVDDFNANKLPQLKDNGLASPVFGFALKSQILLGNLDRAKVVIKALQALQGDKGGDNGTTAILSQLVKLIGQQIEELRKKGDKETLQRATAGFSSILNEIVKGQKTHTPLFDYLLAKCYAGMDEHQKAADLLKTYAAKNVAGAAPVEVKEHQAIQLLLIHELHQLKEIEKASELLKEIMAPRNGKPGWGTRSIDAQKLRVVLLEDEEKYGPAALLADKLVRQLLPKINDNKMKEQYLELYYHLIYCILKNGQVLSSAEQKNKAVKDAAQRILNLEKAQGGFGSDESKKRFEELLEKETDLREQYNALKGSK
jgi:hypothetical protein